VNGHLVAAGRVELMRLGGNAVFVRLGKRHRIIRSDAVCFEIQFAMGISCSIQNNLLVHLFKILICHAI
jgi:hypothetical protein